MIIDKMDDVNSEEINQLLQDIYEYLKKKKEIKDFTEEDRKLAKNLIDRSKKQLQKITLVKIKSTDDCYDVIDSKPDPPKAPVNETSKNESERYVDMTKKSSDVIAPPLPVKKSEMQPKPPAPEPKKCPYIEFPAKRISQEIKHGTLSIRRKVFSIIDRRSKVFGAVHENWLLVYRSGKDHKPFCALDLKEYEAKEDESDPTMTEIDIAKDGGLKKSSGKLAASFKVFQSNSPEKKCYKFVATTHKDMLQWVVNINRSHDKAVRGDKDVEETVYESCEDPPAELIEENIYNEIDIKPPRIPVTHRPVPQIPASPSPSNSAEVYQELEGTGKKDSTSSVNSIEFSEGEDEDETYCELDTVCNEVKLLGLKDRENDHFNINVRPPSVIRQAIEDETENVITENGLPEVDHTEIYANQNGEDSDIKPKPPERSITKPVEDSSASFSSRHPELELKQNEATPNTNTEIESISNQSSELSSKTRESPKPNQASSIVKIIRQRFSGVDSPTRSLETFSRNSRLETFQASPTKEGIQTVFNFMASRTTDIGSPLEPIDSLEPKAKKKKDDDEKPMVLLTSLTDEDSSKKSKKSPITTSKPKKINRKLQY